MTILLTALGVAAAASLVIIWLSQRGPPGRRRPGRVDSRRSPDSGGMSLVLAGVFVIVAIAASLLFVFLAGARI